MHPNVSICIPALNGENYLSECLDSIENQTYDDYEVLIIDDHSTDRTLEVAQQYGRREQRIRIVRNEANVGLVRNWNNCVLQARGQWIKFIFHDDRMRPRCVEQMVAATVGHEAPLIACNREFIFADPEDPQNEYYRSTVRHLPASFTDNTFIPPDDFSRYALRFLMDRGVSTNFIGEPSNMLIRRDAFVDWGTFNVDLIQACDYEYWNRLASNAGVVLVPEVLTEFRIHRGSITSTNTQKRKFRKELDMPGVLHDLLVLPVYWRFRKAVGEKGRDQIRRYLAYLLGQLRKLANPAQGESNVKEWEDFMARYPGCGDLMREPGLGDVARTARRYLEKRLRLRA